jgi:hypothetical protein
LFGYAYSFAACFNDKHKVCYRINMTNENPVRFTLTGNTRVIVKKVTNNKYDFELIFSNGSRKTFMWTLGDAMEFINHKGYVDKLATDALKKFVTIMESR